jgi:hypothetical protein
MKLPTIKQTSGLHYVQTNPDTSHHRVIQHQSSALKAS